MGGQFKSSTSIKKIKFGRGQYLFVSKSKDHPKVMSETSLNSTSKLLKIKWSNMLIAMSKSCQSRTNPMKVKSMRLKIKPGSRK